MKKAPFLQPWSPALEVYFRYEVEEVDGGVRSRVRLEDIEEEILNLEKMDVSRFYAEILCPVLILRAPKGMFNNDDILLPQDALERILGKFPTRDVSMETARIIIPSSFNPVIFATWRLENPSQTSHHIIHQRTAIGFDLTG